MPRHPPGEKPRAAELPWLHPRRVIDLSVAAARRLGMVRDGVAPVRLKVVRWP
jgi:hypothetical protein